MAVGFGFKGRAMIQSPHSDKATFSFYIIVAFMSLSMKKMVHHGDAVQENAVNPLASSLPGGCSNFRLFP
jgi:hypothetical protein